MRVAHSWSGIIVSGALDGLSKGQREKEGKKGGVVKLAFLCSFVPGENVSLIDAIGGGRFRSFMMLIYEAQPFPAIFNFELY